MVDGRVERGRRRRELLVEAALRVTERDGVAGITHRAVAQEAGVASTAGTYHFPTVDDLLVAVITAGAERFAAELRTRMQGSPTVQDFAELVADYLRERRGPAIAEYELYLLAARRPDLRPAAQLWMEAAREVLAQWTDDETAIRAAIAVCDGLLIQGLIADEPPRADEIARTMSYVLNIGSGSRT
ncbi:MAG TPA: TetR family transcriptional regulator [Pseudonocardiaceae bacterium]|jgi:DNA-binding transcriptional regulator YbjK|nr:TetR family transcriptional regulator [Pseudonocardiaceae bacterium]